MECDSSTDDNKLVAFGLLNYFAFPNLKLLVVVVDDWSCRAASSDVGQSYSVWNQFNGKFGANSVTGIKNDTIGDGTKELSNKYCKKLDRRVWLMNAYRYVF